MKSLKSIEQFDLKGKNVFLRLDLNVPLKDGEITDTTRIGAVLPTIKYALEKGAKLVVASHLGRPKTPEDRKNLSLLPIAQKLGELLNIDVTLVEEPSGDATKALLSGLKSGQMILLENLRFEPGETKNDKSLAEVWAKFTQIYINDAFGACHRAHSSIEALPRLVENKGIGFLVQKEVEMLDRLMASKEYPFVGILGGSKVSDKISVIEALLEKVDTLIIGGAMAYTFLAAQGCKVGSSLLEKDKIKLASDIIQRFKVRKKDLMLPIDHIIVPDFNKTSQVKTTAGKDIEEDWMAVDIGPKTLATYCEKIANAGTLFWNGPMGVFEVDEYSKGTFGVAKAMAENQGFTIVGGGDSAAAIAKAGYADKVSHVSTGGGASLEYLQGCSLPGIEVLKC